MLLGYVVGAVGVYSLLLRFSPVVTDDRMAHLVVPESSAHVEILELFPSGESADQANAA
jgi:hypothetical protein